MVVFTASNDTDGRSEMGEWAEKLLCGEGLSRMAESVVRARAQGWVPVAAYRQEASVWHERLKLAGSFERVHAQIRLRLRRFPRR